ncbi:MAG: hypothetical protein MSA07_08235 [Mucispirillum sp.]|uniref:Uncharacterized protein n=1 Tax=Candidatus Mucispirillum faecigallinarum TaxID=2838699 RepID=A0A9D2GUH4_9BACT|nr:hypothetical protein [Mucispirillum sp.]HIZ89609.1 hypothetical protein [Candidatus Mucispirillum faecigallinarum]
MSTFDIMLKQCEVQAEKLCSIDIDEKYLNEIDIFNNYFSQLKQIIESEKENHAKEKVKKLADLLQTFIKRIEEEQAATKNKINTLNRNKNMVGYGAVKYQFAHRINRRY